MYWFSRVSLPPFEWKCTKAQSPGISFTLSKSLSTFFYFKTILYFFYFDPSLIITNTLFMYLLFQNNFIDYVFVQVKQFRFKETLPRFYIYLKKQSLVIKTL